MRERLIGLVEKAELAVASSSGVMSDEALEPIIDLVKTLRVRLSYPEEVLVVALAGGTGSGKSSLFNALVGEELVDVGGVRPTTSQPAASVPVSAGSRFDGFLDHIGVHERHTHEDLPLCLIDLPDTDSVEIAHRQRVDQLLPLVDAVVWVTDPEKYRDARLHHDYLAPLSDHASRFLVVLNQVDRLSSDELGVVLTDLGSALEADGMAKELILPISASPPAGPPIGVDQLVDRLKTLGNGRDLVATKLVADLATATRALAAGAGQSLEFDSRAVAAVNEAVERLGSEDRIGATSRLTEFLDAISAEVDGPTRQHIVRLAADVPAHVARIDSELRSDRGNRRWFLVRRRSFDSESARTKLNESVIRPARSILAKRAVALASIAELAVDVESLGRELAR